MELHWKFVTRELECYLLVFLIPGNLAFYVMIERKNTCVS